MGTVYQGVLLKSRGYFIGRDRLERDDSSDGRIFLRGEMGFLEFLSRSRCHGIPIVWFPLKIREGPADISAGPSVLVAEGRGFEPPRSLRPYTISSRAVSTTHAPFHW